MTLDELTLTLRLDTAEALRNLATLQTRLNALKTPELALTPNFTAAQTAIAAAQKQLQALSSALDTASDGFANLANSAAASGDTVGGIVGALTAQCAALKAAAQINGYVAIDTSSAMAAIGAVTASLGALAAVAASSGVTLNASGASKGGGTSSGRGSSGGRGSSSGSSGSSGKPAWQTALDEALARLDHLRAVGQLTYAEEIDALNDLMARYKGYASARGELEERLYKASQSLAAEQADELDRLLSSLTDALEARYNAAFESERASLDESRAAWRAYRDEAVSAIERQIAALDELSAAEDRAAADEAEQRKISSLRERIAYEQDAYNRASLQKQLAQALADREERLRKLELADQKAALQQQAAQVKQQAQAELDALDDREDALKAYYASLTEQAALQAEAQKLLLSQSQDELLALLGSYAADYDVLGRTLGERLLAGFTGAVGDVSAWFERLAQSWQSIGAAAFGAVGTPSQTASAGAVGAPSVTQTVNIYQPVETPAETAFRVKQAGEALAEELLK